MVQKFKSKLNQLQQSRKLISLSYKQSFLEQYAPNSTPYLPESLRMQLRNFERPGASVVGDVPADTFARDILKRLLIDFFPGFVATGRQYLLAARYRTCGC